MGTNIPYRVLADLTLCAHVLYVAFVVLGLVLVYVGAFLKWRLVKNLCFRVAHLAAIGLVVLQSWLSIVCPLTTLEMHFRTLAGDATYPGSFVSHWLKSILYFDAPPWVFTAAYTLFGLLVLLSWIIIKPKNEVEPRIAQINADNTQGV